MSLIVGWKLFAFRRNSSISSVLLVPYADMTSSINLFQEIGLMLLFPSIQCKNESNKQGANKMEFPARPLDKLNSLHASFEGFSQ